MSRCEHGEKITKFCITQHCHHKEAAGCDYCIKKYHFHLTNTTLLTESDIEGIVKTLTFPSDCKYKSKALQDLASDYLRQLKQSFNSWLDQAQNVIMEKLSHPLLRKQGMLPTYQRIRNRDFRKINAKDLKAINEFAKNSQPQNFKKQQLSAYFSEVEWTGYILDATEMIAKELAKLPVLKETDLLTVQRSAKLNETYDSIIREKERYQNQMRESLRESLPSKTQPSKLEEVTKSSSLMKNRLSRQFSAKEKSSTPKKEVVADIVGKKLTTAQNASKIASIIPVTFVQPKIEPEDKYGNETTEQRAKRLRRRRSSIDQGITDMKFNQTEREKQTKELQLKKKMILETIFSSKESDKEKIEHKVQENEAPIVKEIKNDVPTEEKQHVNLFGGIVKNVFPMPASKLNDSMSYQEDKSEALSNKTSDQNIFQNIFQKGGLNVAQLINSLIPAPPAAKLENQLEVITNKIVRIPLTIPNNKNHLEEIQSPIFKNKRRMDKQHTPGFGIALAAVQSTKQEELPQLPSVKEELKEETERQIPNENAKDESTGESDVIILEMNEKNSLLLFCQALKSDSDRAIELLKAALKYSPNNLSAAEYLSYLYLDSERAKECLEVCESILLKIEDKAEEFEVTLHLHNNRAAALNKLGRYSESIVVLEKCLKYRRKHYFYKNLADAYFSLGIPEKAAMNYEKAIRLDPGYDQAFYNLSVTQFIQEEYTSAKLNIDQALKIDITNPIYRELQKQISNRIQNILR